MCCVSHPVPLEKNLQLAPHLLYMCTVGPNQTVNCGPGLGWGWTKPLAVPYSTKAQVGVWVLTPWLEGISQCSYDYDHLAQLQEFV